MQATFLAIEHAQQACVRSNAGFRRILTACTYNDLQASFNPSIGILAPLPGAVDTRFTSSQQGHPTLSHSQSGGSGSWGLNMWLNGSTPCLHLSFPNSPHLEARGQSFKQRERGVRQIRTCIGKRVNNIVPHTTTRGLFVPGRVQDTLYLHGFPTVLPRRAMSHQTLRSTWVVMV